MTHPSSGHDPMGWQYELQLALEDPALAAFDSPGVPGPEAAAAAYRVALCLGYCRLLGADLPAELDGTLPPREAMAAGEELIRHCAFWIDEARQLPTRWDAAPPGVEDQYAADMLQARMDAWAAYVAISEAHEDCVTQQEPQTQEFGRLLDQLLDSVELFDRTLQEPEVLAILSTLVGTPLLDNWRKMLRIPEGPFLPWWLEGTLEQEDERIAAEIERDRTLVSISSGVASQPPPTPAIIPRHSAAAIWEVPIVEALAAEPTDQTPPLPVILKWASPDGRWIARLSCPRRLAAGGHLPLEFLTPGGQPAVDLSGQSVWLAGQQEVIDSQGVAKFDLQNLRTVILQPNQPITLEVGQERAEWPAT